jgi:Sec-independent protein secretion pathway component TatC
MLALAIPMTLLYEIGIWATQLFIRKTADPQGKPEPDAEITKS